MELKYKTKDVMRLFEIFGNLQEKKKLKNITAEDIKPLVEEYSEEAIATFLDSVEAIANNHDDDENYLKENYWGIVGYICIRMNICKPKPRHENF